MRKSDWVTQVAERLGAEKATTQRTIDMAMAEIGEALARGEGLRIPGLGTFKVADQMARRVRNPQTGDLMLIPAQRRVTFRAADALKAAIQPPKKATKPKKPKTATKAKGKPKGKAKR